MRLTTPAIAAAVIFSTSPAATLTEAQKQAVRDASPVCLAWNKEKDEHVNRWVGSLEIPPLPEPGGDWSEFNAWRRAYEKLQAEEQTIKEIGLQLGCTWKPTPVPGGIHDVKV